MLAKEMLFTVLFGMTTISRAIRLSRAIMKQKFKLYVDSFIRHKELRKLNYRSGIVGFLSMTIEVRMDQFQYSIIGKMTFLRSRLYDHENGFLGI